MLSICIPIYNYDCSVLVSDLLRQMSQQQDKVELILADDASDEEFKLIFEKLPQAVRLLRMPENIGRSAIRNLLAEKASYPNLLFIDGDSGMLSEDFIANYLSVLKKETAVMVICGGSVYQTEEPSVNYMLRWKYSRSRERKSSTFNKKHPYQSFTTNNVMIKKAVFQHVKFDERISDYGHEDTLFGYELMKRKIPLLHLDNVVENGDLDTNEEYLVKSRESISNLLKIAGFLKFDEEFIRFIPLLNFYFKLKIVGLELLLRIWFNLNRKRLEKNFINGKVNLRRFDFYRLGVLSYYFKRLKR